MNEDNATEGAEVSHAITSNVKISRDPGTGIEIAIECIHPEARIPKQGSDTAAGYDLYAVDSMTIPTGAIRRVPLGFKTSLPADIHGRIESRSGMAFKGMVVLTGVIDADYRGEWMVIMMNVTEESQSIAPGDRVAQVVLRPTVRRPWVAGDVLEDSARGAGGFGSTGA